MSQSPFVFLDKPSGVTTHTSLNDFERSQALADLADGFVEAMSERAGQSLLVVHRLDKETSGVICFARDRQTAAHLAEAFNSRTVEKSYLFLTDRTHRQDEFWVESHIERQGSRFVSLPPRTVQTATGETRPTENARTFFRRIQTKEGLSLWEAQPQTGKPHQIRLHAEAEGIPILGDTLHGGRSFPCLCLLSAKIRFSFNGEIHSHEVPLPAWFQDLSLCKDLLLCQWLTALDRRERWLRSCHSLAPESRTDLESQTLRWIHSEGDPLRVEQLGSVHALSWYGDGSPSPREWQSLRHLIELRRWPLWYLQERSNRGQTPQQEKLHFGHDTPPTKWVAQENGLKFEFRLESGLSPGLFLDQRRNRQWVRGHSSGRTVLNLFCYTGGFSVCAASGGAVKTVSVDLSKTFLEWAKINFSINDLSLEGHEFRAIDSREYLSWAKKKGLSFDLVICDPPSFGRSKVGVFSIEKDFVELMKSLLQVTAPKGRILFSTNFEKWSMEDLEKRTRQAAQALSLSIELQPTPSPDWDFELPRQPRNMKSFFVLRH